MSKPTEFRESRPVPVRRPSIFRTVATVLAAGILFSTPAQGAVAIQALEDIEAAVVRFVEQQYPPTDDLRVSVGRLDQRLRLNRCRQALESRWAPGSATLGQATVAVRCTGIRPWKLYVPVRVALRRQVAVTTRPMARGERIRRQDLTLEKRSLGQLRGTIIDNPQQVQGYVLRYAIPAGKVLTARMLSAPKLVRRGQRVVFTAVGNGLNIQMKGIALEDGQMGETVKIRNPVSKRIMYGTVTAPGKVHTSTP